ncbi:MAG: phosphoribosylformylglycinamidine cyclo-ligase [Bacillota bacterium]|nr:phosphoribosylformylglycinamidine cyclo-ligase [Bacillota bacterium]
MEKITYKDAGVDTREGERAVSLMKEHVKKTFNPNVLTGLGSFGSLFRLDTAGMEEPVLVAGTDGVGTKLKIAFLMDRHHTVGQDCVAMCVNDVLCQGAQPLFFLDYIATGKVKAEKIADIVRGVAEGCLQGGCALVGGETAEMPDFYPEGEYDMAGFAVGLADRKNIIDGSGIREGDVIVGVPSSGLHSNGYSLVRKVFFEKMGLSVHDHIEELGEALGEALLRPTKIYTQACREVFAQVKVRGVVHVTGGGFYENIPRVLPEGLRALIQKGSWDVPPIFRYLQRCSGGSDEDMFAAFNMGVGMMFFVREADGEKTLEALSRAGETGRMIGRVVKGEGVAFAGPEAAK